MASQTIGLFEAKTHLSELVARAEQGDEVIITRHNKPVAKIVSISQSPGFDEQRRRDALARITLLRDRLSARGGPVTRHEIAEWIREGRR